MHLHNGLSSGLHVIFPTALGVCYFLIREPEFQAFLPRATQVIRAEPGLSGRSDHLPGLGLAGGSPCQEQQLIFEFRSK